MGWARVVALLVASVTSLFLLAVLGMGFVLVTMDWTEFACFDDPACTTQDPGLSAVRTSSWLLASVAVIATAGAVLLAFRLRRVAHAVAVVALCATTVVIAQVLWARL